MNHLIETYLAKLNQYHYLSTSLYLNLEPRLHLVPVDRLGIKFVPQKTISEEIREWSQPTPPIPPAAWVEPRKGDFELNDDVWEYAFHGAGLSFFHQQTSQDISIEFTASGELGVTKYTTAVFFETLPSKNEATKQLVDRSDELFGQAVALGYLVATPPLLGDGFDDQTFVRNKMYV